ncbi:hypothetical protein AALO_G00206200 [Alosa alosa]|uniref:Uncharacterized protein n=1 Tax=Alosa alosa TaxID=278164 RepID=A0AAV6G6Q3_9TELE|nr:hypothetical protein AALO_G00206200 [Alosa alosa]
MDKEQWTAISQGTIGPAVSCEDCFPENTECILEYSKCVPLPYKRSSNPAREFTHQWASSTDQGKVGLSRYYNMLLDYVWKSWLLPSTCCVCVFSMRAMGN